MSDLIIGGKPYQEYVDEMYQVLLGFVVDLDEDPLEAGPSSLNEKIAQTRQYANKCQVFILTVQNALNVSKRNLRSIESRNKILYSDLLASDHGVRAGRDAKERDAIASTKLRAQMEEEDEYRAQCSELETLFTVIRTVKSNLKDTETRIKDQISLCQQELAMSKSWGGSQSGGAFDSNPEKTPLDNDLMRQARISNRGGMNTANPRFVTGTHVDPTIEEFFQSE